MTAGGVLVRASERRRVPWRNGGGTTEEIAVHLDPDTGRPLWRISLADLGSESSAFSTFPGMRRVFTVVGAHGVTLTWPTRSERLNPWQPCAFDGADAPLCTPEGNSDALNVMVDGSRARPYVAAVDLASDPVTTGHHEMTALFVRSGVVEHGGRWAGVGDCILLRESGCRVQGPATALLIRIHL